MNVDVVLVMKAQIVRKVRKSMTVTINYIEIL